MDTSTERFDFRMGPTELQQLAALADYFHRNRADTLRLLIREVHKILELAPVRLELPAEIAEALKSGKLTVDDLSAETLGLGDISQYDLLAYTEKQHSPK